MRASPIQSQAEIPSESTDKSQQRNGICAQKAKTKGVYKEVLGCPQRAKTESEWYVGAQTCIWMVEDNVVEVPFDREHLLEVILSPENLNKSYKTVVRNKGCGDWVTGVLLTVG